jgi:hypothetical protein
VSAWRATGAGRREADSWKGGRGTTNDASTFCLNSILFRSRDKLAAIICLVT